VPDNQVKLEIYGEDHASQPVHKVEESLDGFVEKLGGLEKLLEGLAVEEVVRRLVEFTAQTLEGEMALVKLSEKTGIAITELSGLAAAAKLSNIEQADFETSLKKLATTIANAAAGEQKSEAALRALGISARDSSGHVITISDALAKVADKFASTKDGTEKAALAVEVFGRQGLAMIPMLNEGSAGLAKLTDEARKLGVVLTEDDAKALKQLEDDLGRLKLSAQGMAQQFLAGLVPGLDRMAKSALDGGGGFDILRRAGEGASVVLRTIQFLAQGIAESLELGVREILALTGAVEHSKETLTDIWTRLDKDLFGTTQEESAKTTEQLKGDLEKQKVDAEKIRKQQLANEISYWQQATSVTQAQNNAQLQNLQLLYAQSLISVQSYFDKRRAIQLDSLDAEMTALQAELELYDKALKDKTLKEEERLQVQEKINAATAKQAELQAQIAVLEGKNPKTGEEDPLVKRAQAMEIYAAQAQKLGQQIDDVFSRLDADIQAVNTAVDNYQITSIQGEQRINELRDQARQKVEGLTEEYHSLASASGDPKLIANADKYEKKIDELKIHFSSLRKEAIDAATRDTTSFFTGLIDGSGRGAAAFKGFIKSLISDLAAYEARLWAVWLISKALGWISHMAGAAGSGPTLGDAGPLTPTIGDDTVAFAAGGGSFGAGDWSWVGENGPELVRFGSDATVIPSSASMAMGGGGGDTINIDARGAQAGVSQEILNAMRVHEERAVARAMVGMSERSRRRA
jgi:hypothetical protein